MSLLSICQNVLNITGWDSLSTIGSSTDKTAVQIKAICNQELTNLAARFNWRQLMREHSFTTVQGQPFYTMEDDFAYLITDSVYNKDEYYKLRSSMTEYQWNAWQHGLLGSLSHQRYRLMSGGSGNVLKLSPTPETAEDLVLFYQANTPIRNDDGTFKKHYENDEDTSVLPEDVIEMGVMWRFRHAKGLDYSAELAEYNEMSRTRFAQTVNESSIPIPAGVVSPEVTDGYVPDSGFGP